jgi:hypothetical protein
VTGHKDATGLPSPTTSRVVNSYASVNEEPRESATLAWVGSVTRSVSVLVSDIGLNGRATGLARKHYGTAHLSDTAGAGAIDHLAAVAIGIPPPTPPPAEKRRSPGRPASPRSPAPSRTPVTGI